MASRQTEGALERTIGELFLAPNPASRAQLLLDAVRARLGATACALCRPKRASIAGSDWFRTAVCGEPEGLPSTSQVAAVVAGELDPHLPPRRVVVVGDHDLALAIDGADPDAEEVDLVAGLLFTYAAIADVDVLGDGLDEVRGAVG